MICECLYIGRHISQLEIIIMADMSIGRCSSDKSR